MKPLGQCLYEHNGRLYGEFNVFGRRTKRRLTAIAVRQAREEIARKKSDHARARIGLCPDPFAPPVRIRDLIEKYTAAGCPDRRRQARAGDKLDHCKAQLTNLAGFWGDYAPENVTVGACDRYHDYRVARVARGPGHRSVEVELCALSSVLHWAARSELIRYNPLASGRPTYRRAETVVHCSSSMPESDEELHTLGAHLLDNPRSEVLGWQLLLEALTGCRTSEILRLRWDAGKIGTEGGPGYRDDTSLYVNRCKHGIFPYVLLDVIPGHSPLRDLLTALRHWHDIRYPRSPWFLPGRDPSQPLDPSSLDHALSRATPLLDLPRRTSHGLRAFHVRALRSLGIDDSEIAKRLGQRSGVGLVERVYGRSEPGWFGLKRVDFLPDSTTPNSWLKWLPTREDAKIVATQFG